MEAVFHNPSVGSDDGWTHGIFLRGKATNFFHAIFIQRSGKWYHSYRNGPDGDWTRLRQEVSSSIDTTPGGANRLRLVVIENQGWLYINGQPQGTLDLSAVEFTQARLALDHEVDDAVTRFEDFIVWRWHPSLAAISSETPVTPTSGVPYAPIYGPVSGSILHELEYPLNSFELFRGPMIDDNVMAEATFYNPHPAVGTDGWNYGFLGLC